MSALGSRLCRLPARAAPACTCRAVAPQQPAEPSFPSPAAADKLCELNDDCQSGACEDGRCAEAKYCASRFLYDNLGVNIQLRTFDDKEALLGDQKAIKCGQCVCQDCPVRMRLGAPASKIVVCPPARPPAACCQPSLGLPTWRRPMLPIARRTR